MIENTCPILSVSDLEASLTYYTENLGFSLDWHEAGVAAGISRDRGALMLIVDQGPKGAYVWVGVQDARELHDELVGRGTMVVHEPKNHPWALEFKVQDLDGNRLRIGSNPLAGVSFDDWVP